jgi:hypothetical protein
MTLSIVTLSIMTLSIMTNDSKMTFKITINKTLHSPQWHSIQSVVMMSIIHAMTFMLSVTNKAFWLSVILLNVVAPHNTSLLSRKALVSVS